MNTALNSRIQETTDSRNKIQLHLNKTLQEVFDMEKNIELLKKSIQDKEAPMQVKLHLFYFDSPIFPSRWFSQEKGLYFKIRV